MSTIPLIAPGLSALAIAAADFDIVVDVAKLQHRLGLPAEKTDLLSLCRCANWVGLRARLIKKPPAALSHLPLPILFCSRQGWCVLQHWEAGDKGALVFFVSQAMSQRLTLTDLKGLWPGKGLLLARREPGVVKRFGLGWFVPLIIKHRRQLWQFAGVSLLLQGIVMATSVLSEKLIDAVLISRGTDSLVVLGIAMLGLALAEPGFGFLRGTLFAHLSGKVGSELDTHLYRHLLNLPFRYFAERKAGHIINRLRETDQVRHFMTGSVFILISDIFFIGFFFVLLLHYNVTLTGLVTGTLLVCVIFWGVLGSLLRKRVDAQYQSHADTTAFLTEMFIGMETIKVTATEKRFLHRWRQCLSAAVKSGAQTTYLGILAVQGISLIQKISTALILWFGVKQALAGAMTPGQLVAFNMLAGYVTQPILRIVNVWQEFQRTLTALKWAGELFDHAGEPGQSGLTSLPATEGSIRFEQVTFSYHPDSPGILRNVTLDIAPGEWVGITGPSGSGKSTLTRLLQRFYLPQQGNILVGGQNITILDINALRGQMGVVLQESVLFSGTVAENIRLGCPDATRTQLEEAARRAGAAEFILALPHGYETSVGEKGSRLSGGQRQRIALARALVSDPKILILDEATSALDYGEEANILCQLPAIRRNRTVMMIAHRLHTLQHCDRIVVLTKNGIEAQGTHAELIHAEGHYAQLWQLQTGGRP